MCNLLVRLLMIVAMLGSAGYTLADDDANTSKFEFDAYSEKMKGVDVSIDGYLNKYVNYYIYDSDTPLKINGLINKPFDIYRPVWGWLIYDADAENCNQKYIVWSTKSITRHDHIFTVCNSPVTWLYMRNNPADWEHDISSYYYGRVDDFSLIVGPENSTIESMPEMKDEFSDAPRDLKWQKLHTYTLRYFNKLNVLGNPYGYHYAYNRERKFTYMGSIYSYIQDQSSGNLTYYKNENFIIKIDAKSPVHNGYSDYLQSCKAFVTDISPSINDSDKSNGGKPWEAPRNSAPGNDDSNIHYVMIDLSNSLYKAGHTYNVDTNCRYELHGSDVIFSPAEKTLRTFSHKFVVVSEPNTGTTSPAIIISLAGHFLADGSIHVQGKFDDSSPDQPKFKYAVKESASQTANWLAPASVKWNPGNTNPVNCAKCFSFVIPASNVSAKDKISLVQVLPDVHSNEQAAHPDIAAFTLRELITAGFANAQGETWACGEDNEVTAAKDNNGTSLITLKLTLKHAVDNITGNIWLPSLPVTYKGNGTVSYAASGQSAVTTSDISITENDKGKSAVNWAASTADKVLKPGTYLITLPVDVPAYRRENVGPESLSLYANVYAAKSILLKQRESSADPDHVECQDMFNGAVP